LAIATSKSKRAGSKMGQFLPFIVKIRPQIRNSAAF
jgi:hypothetical protein